MMTTDVADMWDDGDGRQGKRANMEEDKRDDVDVGQRGQ